MSDANLVEAIAVDAISCEGSQARLANSSHSPAAGVAGNDRRAGTNSGNASTGDPSGRPSPAPAAASAAARYLFSEEP